MSGYNKNIIIYGCGYVGKRLYKLCREVGTVEGLCFCDNDRGKWGTLLENEIEVLSYDEISRRDLLENSIFIVSPKYQYEEIVNDLIEKQFPQENIFVYADNGRATCKEQYFDDAIIQLAEDEVFVDGGCFDLRTSKLLSKLCIEKGKV